MASTESSNRNVPLHDIPKLQQYLRSANITPRTRTFGVLDYAVWFNAFSTQLQPYHDLVVENGYKNNSLDDLASTYKKMCNKINNEKRKLQENGEFRH